MPEVLRQNRPKLAVAVDLEPGVRSEVVCVKKLYVSA
jgi:hypothetical protein